MKELGNEITTPYGFLMKRYIFPCYSHSYTEIPNF